MQAVRHRKSRKNQTKSRAAKDDLPAPSDTIVGKENQPRGSRAMPETEFPAMLRVVAAGCSEPRQIGIPQGCAG